MESVERSGLRRAALDALAVLVPTTCSGCGAADRAVCAPCCDALVPRVRSFSLPAAGGALPVWTSADYAGVVRRLIVAFKDTQRTDCARELARLLRHAVLAAGRAASAPVELTVIPSSRESWRRRGYHPVETLVRRAGLPVSRTLRQRRRTEDQAGLSAGQRQRNRRDTLTAVPGVQGRTFILVDDVVTTGATLAEAARALRRASADVVGCAAVAHTRKQFDASIGRQSGSSIVP